MLPTGFTGSHTALQVLHWRVWLAWSWFCRWGKMALKIQSSTWVYSVFFSTVYWWDHHFQHLGRNIKKHLRIAVQACFGLSIRLGACFLAMSQCFIYHVSVRHSSVTLWPFGVISPYMWISVYFVWFWRGYVWDFGGDGIDCSPQFRCHRHFNNIYYYNIGNCGYF